MVEFPVNPPHLHQGQVLVRALAETIPFHVGVIIKIISFLRGRPNHKHNKPLVGIGWDGLFKLLSLKIMKQ
jgi:hypothetical protein